MSEFLKSLKDDLLDRRLLPFVALVGVALLAAVGYAVMGGSSSASSAAGASAGPVAPVHGLAVSGASTEKAVAETTDGVAEQRAGHARNPFAPIAKASSTSTTPAASGSSASSAKSSGSGSSSTASPAPAAKTETSPSPSKPSAKKKSTTIYHVAIEFGVFPAGSTPETVVLTPYENLKLDTALPQGQTLIVFRGVTSHGRSATFSIVGEAILHGVGSCLPSPTQCQALDLKPGESEQLEYLAPNGETTVYELRVVAINAAQASAATAARAWGESKAGREILRRAGLTELPFLRYSSQPGVLVFPLRQGFSARAHAALEPRR